MEEWQVKISNFLAKSPNGIIFLEPVDTFRIYNNGEELFKLMDSIVQKGEENVTQVITGGASTYVTTSQML